MSSSADRRLRLAGHHEDGKLVVPGMPRGDCRISIIPKDTKLLCTTVDVISAKDMDPVTIEIQRLVPNIVQVLDPKGQPVAKATVLVIVPGNRELAGRPTTTINNPRSDTQRAFSSNPATTFDTEIYRATTDAGGQCIVYGIRGRDDLILGVRIGRGKVFRDKGVSFGKQGNGHTVTLDEE